MLVKAIVRLTIAGIVALILMLVTVFSFGYLYNSASLAPDTIIVLGENLSANEARDVMEERVLAALGLCGTSVEHVILTGGNFTEKYILYRELIYPSKRSEAKMMNELWKQHNKNCKAKVHLEEKATRTYENAFYSIALMNDNELDHAVVVTSKAQRHTKFFFLAVKLLLFSKIKFNIVLV